MLTLIIMGNIANTFSELNLESFAIRVFPRQQELATKSLMKFHRLLERHRIFKMGHAVKTKDRLSVLTVNICIA